MAAAAEPSGAFRSHDSTPHGAPMQEINQMEIQFNNPQHQAAMAAEQQRAAAIQAELDRQK